MKRLFIILIIGIVLGMTWPTELFAKKRVKPSWLGHGFYKDIFMDSGIRLTSRRTLPAQEHLGLTMEFFVSAPNKALTRQDTLQQTKIFCGSEKDTNGVLLYPDGAPRFRMIYVNGGAAKAHLVSLTPIGCDRLRKYVAAGGSFIGTCAGAYIASGGLINRYNRKERTDIYLGIYPGMVRRTRLQKRRPNLLIEKQSPLLQYYDFGGDRLVERVFHNFGCYMEESKLGEVPPKTEILARYIFDDTDRVQIDRKPSIWAIKESAKRGRVISCGSHPEGVKEGERMELMAAMILYAMDGNGQPVIKAKLAAGKTRLMDKRTEDNNPAFTRIGDRQYHHFTIDVPKKCSQAVITLKGVAGEDNFDLTLCANRKELAFCGNATSKETSKGCNKTLVINKPKAGKWYVSVLCETTVTTHTGKYGTEYSGRTDVLNGVPYSIRVDYK